MNLVFAFEFETMMFDGNNFNVEDVGHFCVMF